MGARLWTSPFGEGHCPMTYYGRLDGPRVVDGPLRPVGHSCSCGMSWTGEETAHYVLHLARDCLGLTLEPAAMPVFLALAPSFTWPNGTRDFEDFVGACNAAVL